MEKNKLVNALRNILVSVVLAYFILGLIGLIYPEGWIFLFSVFFSFVLSDLLLNTFINGGKGFAKIFGENEFACKGHSYLVLLFGIVIGTILSAIGTNALMAYLQSIMPWYQASLLTDLLAVLAVAGDLEWRFYSK